MSQAVSQPSNVVASVREVAAIAILRLRAHQQATGIGRRLVEAGLPVMEVTFDHPDAAHALRSMVEQLPDNAVLGAGTIRSVEQIAECKAAGGRFCVSPHTDVTLIRACLEEGLEPIPGAYSATEVAAALDAGAKLVKLFPAGPVGVGYLKAMRGPFPDVLFVPTGGIRHNEVAPWLAAGAVAVGLGSDLVPATPGEFEMEAIADRAQAVAKEIEKARTDAP